jgi:two-component system response regulator YesN
VGFFSIADHRGRKMYSVLVVDDEPLVRLTLKNMNDWESFGFFFGYEAAHGKQALEILQRPERIDIVILDINMPVMNGLELIEWIQFMDDKPEILILSCHHDFHLVRQAFKLGVHDYILKTEMEPDTMLAHLKEIASRLEKSEQRKAHASTLSQVERKYLRRQFLKDLLSGQVDRDVSAKVQQLDIRLREDSLCLMVFFHQFIRHR